MNITDGFGAVVAWIVALGALLAALGVIGTAIARAWRRVIGTKKSPGWGRRAVAAVDEVRDLPPLVRKLIADVAAIQKELHPNGGSSLRDSNDRIEAVLGSTPEGTTP